MQKKIRMLAFDYIIDNFGNSLKVPYFAVQCSRDVSLGTFCCNDHTAHKRISG